MSNCQECFHEEENHEEGHFCTGDLTCICQKFTSPVLVEFAQKIEKVKHEYKTLYDRCKYLLDTIEPIRNAGEKSFYACYIWIWHGFKIKQGTILDQATWKRLPSQDSVNRAKRFVKEDFEHLRTYDKKVLIEQTAIYQALTEMAIGV